MWKNLIMGVTLKRIAVLICAWGFLGNVAAQVEYPTRAVRFIVPGPAGGVADLFARSVAASIAARWGQPVVVDNRAGADTAIGTVAVSAAPADGYTFLLVLPNYFSIPLLQGSPTWNPLQDFVAVGKIGTSPNALVARGDFIAVSVRELVDRARAEPGRVSAGIAQGSSLHFNLEALLQATGIKVLIVPYNGGPPIVQALGSRTLDFAFLPFSLAAPHVISGRLRGLAIASDSRSALLPDLPTIKEAGYPAANFVPWYGIAVKRGAPPDVLARINAEINLALGSADVQARLTQLGSQVSPALTLDALDVLIRSDYESYEKLIRNGQFNRI